MGGLLVLMALCLFTGFCWLVSGWIIRNKSKKYYGLKRGIVFLIPALAPVYIQVVEYVLFQQACKEAVVYFPEEKLPLPEILITDNDVYKNRGRYLDGMFKYVVSPHYLKRRTINIAESTEQFKDYIVYPYKSESLVDDDRKKKLKEVNYALLHQPTDSDNWYSYSNETYIYDFLQQKKISRIVRVSPRSRNHSLVGLFHSRFKGCKNTSKFNFSYENIIRNTFIMENK